MKKLLLLPTLLLALNCNAATTEQQPESQGDAQITEQTTTHNPKKKHSLLMRHGKWGKQNLLLHLGISLIPLCSYVTYYEWLTMSIKNEHQKKKFIKDHPIIHAHNLTFVMTTFSWALLNLIPTAYYEYKKNLKLKAQFKQLKKDVATLKKEILT